ncbi:MAG: hypothetical protein HY873_04435 [Chloroflexi bacterium]|nr:hypothetical protein [Chloroflexota bacterium]
MQDGLPAPPPEAFANEHITLPENRLNVALFGLMLLDEAKCWLLSRVGEPPSAIIYPPQQVNGVRPDFVVVEEGRVKAWIEVELGTEDAEQMRVYRDVLSEPVHSVVGDLSAGGTLSLQELASFVQSMRLTEQARANASVFVAIVNQLAGQRSRFDYIAPDLSLRDAPLIASLLAHIDDILDIGVPPVTRGRVMLSTVTNRGWTLRVYSDPAGMKSTTLLWDQSLGRGTIRLPAKDKLEQLLNRDFDAVHDYCDFLKRCGADVSTISGARSLGINESLLCSRAEALAVHIRRLASIY